MTTHPAAVLPGETLAQKYRVEHVLGQGGMGVVLAARHLELDERVAIKLLLVNAADGAAVSRFLREARAAAKVKSEHVCRVLDAARLDTGEPYLVMEYLEGQDLGRKLATEGAQPVRLVAGWMIEICDALAEAHAIGVIHRDLKPANVFLAKRSDGTTIAKVLDFGISKLPAAISVVTQSNNFMGSPAYMSPEQIESAANVDSRADVWSLGVMMYELLTGRVPFDGNSLVQLAVKIREHRAPSVTATRSEVPEALSAIVARCLSKNRADRFASVGELALALRPYAPDEIQSLAARIARRAPASAVEDRGVASGEEPGMEPTDPAPPVGSLAKDSRPVHPQSGTLMSGRRSTASGAAHSAAADTPRSAKPASALETGPRPKLQRRPRGYIGRNHETLGEDILSVLRILKLPEHVLGAEETSKLSSVDPNGWYPIEWLLDLTERLDKHIGHYGLLQLGRTIFKLWHEEAMLKMFSSARQVVYAYDGMYHRINRGIGIGGWKVLKFEPGYAELEKTTPHHCAMEQGVILGSLAAVGCPVSATQRQCLRKGADSCIFELTSTITDERWGGDGVSGASR